VSQHERADTSGGAGRVATIRTGVTVQTIVLFNEWGTEYLERRYLEHDSLEQLEQREADLLANIATIGANGEAIVYTNEQFRRSLAHVHAEYKQRNVPVPVNFGQQRYVHHKRSAELWAGMNLAHGSYLLKFGNARWMKGMLAEGSIRIANAKSYDSSSLAPAIRDCEIEFTEECYGMTVDFVPHAGATRRIETIGNVRRVSKSETDFYIASFGEMYEHRLFDDFSRENKQVYDACLVVRERQAFIGRMKQEGERKLPGWDFYASPVAYHDPHEPVANRDGVDVFFAKHFRYAYQQEFRMAWIPPRAYENLAPVYFELGALNDCCELLTL
jgi:hypothetical protein